MTEEIKLETRDRFFKFTNLAKVHYCDKYIQEELAIANIPALEFPNEDTTRHEVPYHVVGVLGRDQLLNELKENPEIIKHLDSYSLDVSEVGFIFRRAWVYWVVSGYVPIHVANILYEYSCALDNSIRANGHAGNINPNIIITDGLICGAKCIRQYHIDTQEGLNFFVKTMHEYKLI